MPHPRVAWVVLGALAVSALAGSAEPDVAPPGGPSGAVDGGRPPSPDLLTISGKITEVTWSSGTLTVAAHGGPVSLRVDRNTSVFLVDRLGTLRDLAVGAPVRAQLGADRRAAWIEIDPGAVRATAAHEPPATGTPAGPPRLPAPPARRAGAGGISPPSGEGTPPGPVRPVPAGPGSPEPSPGTVPPPGRGPAPTGPGLAPTGEDSVTGGGRS